MCCSPALPLAHRHERGFPPGPSAGNRLPPSCTLNAQKTKRATAQGRGGVSQPGNSALSTLMQHLWATADSKVADPWQQPPQVSWTQMKGLIVYWEPAENNRLYCYVLHIALQVIHMQQDAEELRWCLCSSCIVLPKQSFLSHLPRERENYSD